MGRILDGVRLARELHAEVRENVERLLREHGVRPRLAAIMVGNDPASAVYIEAKRRACEQDGIASDIYNLPASVTEDELVHLIYRLNRERAVHGILVQLPLPERAAENAALAEIAPEKDVDGLSPANRARLLTGEQGLRPCTPLAVMELIARSGEELAGKRAVIIGASLLVGKPLALMLLEYNATVVLCHEFTRELEPEIANADFVIAAAGKPGLVRGDWIRPGAVVIDVGINRTRTGLVGDVEFERARERAGFITPVPGGVGPMTVAMLARNTLFAAQRLAIQSR
ncbi:MAG: bifunctional methylenetetrahydrofolate dehydrogenase/methenyltetrahydrofolate cyclohydrolase FolD [Candidatus Binataceae bacterium]